MSFPLKHLAKNPIGFRLHNPNSLHDDDTTTITTVTVIVNLILQFSTSELINPQSLVKKIKPENQPDNSAIEFTHWCIWKGASINIFPFH